MMKAFVIIAVLFNMTFREECDLRKDTMINNVYTVCLCVFNLCCTVNQHDKVNEMQPKCQ